MCERYKDEAVSTTDFSEVRSLAFDETSSAKGHDYGSLFADANPIAVECCRSLRASCVTVVVASIPL